MNAAIATSVLLIVLPIAFNAAFTLLAMKFDYPDILRRPTAEVLERYRAGGSALILLWWGFAMTAVLFAPLALLLAQELTGADVALLTVGAGIGVLAAVVQFLGLIRWPFLVPYLARVAAEPDASAARKDAVDIIFQAFNRYLGVAVGEHLGFLLTGVWSILVGVATIQAGLPAWIGLSGIGVGVVLGLCSFEFVGRFEVTGWSLAARLTPVAYVTWSLWLVVLGVTLLF